MALLLRLLDSVESSTVETKPDGSVTEKFPKWLPTVLLTLDSLAQLPLTEPIAQEGSAGKFEGREVC